MKKRNYSKLWFAVLVAAALELGCNASGSDPSDAAADDADMSFFVPNGGDAGPVGDAGGASTEDGGAAGDMACEPKKVSCGLCGTMTGTCVAGKLTFGPCEKEGVCAPGTVAYTPDGCSTRTCNAFCQWPMWGLKPGAMCPLVGSMQGCEAGISCPHYGHQSCLASCKWGPCEC